MSPYIQPLPIKQMIVVFFRLLLKVVRMCKNTDKLVSSSFRVTNNITGIRLWIILFQAAVLT